MANVIEQAQELQMLRAEIRLVSIRRFRQLSWTLAQTICGESKLLKEVTGLSIDEERMRAKAHRAAVKILEAVKDPEGELPLEV